MSRGRYCSRFVSGVVFSWWILRINFVFLVWFEIFFFGWRVLFGRSRFRRGLGEGDIFKVVIFSYIVLEVGRLGCCIGVSFWRDSFGLWVYRNFWGVLEVGFR